MLREAIRKTKVYWGMVAGRAGMAIWRGSGLMGWIITAVAAFILALTLGLLGMFGVIPESAPIIGEAINNAVITIVSLVCAGGLLVVAGFIVLAYIPAKIHEEQNEDIGKQRRRNTTIQRKFNKFKESLPRIVYHKYREGPQFLTRADDATKVLAQYRILQIWFQNIPSNPSADAVAYSVTAIIEFHDSKDNKLFEGVPGQWAITKAPTYISPENLGEGNPRIDMEPGFSSYKLMVALKYPNEDECYPYAVEHFMGSYVKSLDTVGKNPDMIIPKGTHIVRVQLRGVNVTDEFEFEFINPGAGENMELVPI